MKPRKAGALALPILLTGFVCANFVSSSVVRAAEGQLAGASEISASELQMLRMLNADRQSTLNAQETKGHAEPLVWDARLAAVARQHSQEMADHGYFGHEGLDGSMPNVRVTKAGIRWSSTGENIAKFSDVAAAEAAFMNEPKFQHNHRGNILSSSYTHVGIGIVRDADGMFYITQEFAAF